MDRTDAKLLRLFRVVGQRPKVSPNPLFKLRHFAAALVRRRRRAYLVDLKSLVRLLVLAKNPLEEADCRAAIEVVGFDVLVIELSQQAINKHTIALNRELLPLIIQRRALLVHLKEFNLSLR